jgi:dihydroflavonol-4-reductase
LKVLVTGASGIIGSYLSRELTENGFLVRALLDPADESPALEGLDVEQAAGDLLDPEWLQSSLNGVQAVFHCESSSVYWPPRSKQVISRNVAGTRNVLVTMAKAGVERLVHVGSAFSFGAGTVDEPGTEDTPYDGGRFNLACIDSMKIAQDVVLRYNESGKVLCLVLNPTLVVGSAGWMINPLSVIARHLASGKSSYPPGGINVVGAADVARAILKALGRGKSGNCYIIGAENLSYKELFEKMALALGVKAPTDPYGDLQFLTRGSIGSLLGKLRGKAPPLTLELARLGAASLYYSHDKAARELEFCPGPVDHEIEMFCRQYTGR